MLSIIIVNHKNPPLLRLCLKSLQRVLPVPETGDFAYEIIVVDVAAEIETEQLVVEEFPTVRYAPFKKNIGYTKGVNEGLKLTKGEISFIINSDIIPLPGALEIMHRFMLDNPKVGIMGPQLLNFDGTLQQSCFRFYTPITVICRRTWLGRLPFGQKILDKFNMIDKDLTRPLAVDWLMGSALMVSKKAYNKVGPMDEKLFLYMSDVDWPRQFWENGYQVVFYPRASMYHYHRHDSRGSLIDAIFKKQTRWHIKDAFHYFRKYGFAYKTFI